MKNNIILLFIIKSFLFCESKIWDSHSAHVLPKDRWEMGIFQPFRYGISNNIEYTTYPLLFYIMPNVSIKQGQGEFHGFDVARKLSLLYPTPILNMFAKKGIGGLIDPNITIPPMMRISGTMILTKEIMLKRL